MGFAAILLGVGNGVSGVLVIICTRSFKDGGCVRIQMSGRYCWVEIPPDVKEIIYLSVSPPTPVRLPPLKLSSPTQSRRP